MMVHLLQMKGLFGGQYHEDDNLHLKNFIDMCLPFEIAHISRESIQLRLFPFSLTREATLWLQEFLTYSITLLVELMEAFLDQFFHHQECYS